MNKLLIAIGAAILAALGIGVYAGRARVARGGHALVAEMEKLLGTPYLWGGKDLSHGGLDCSGAITWAMQQAGLVPKGFVKSADQLYRMASKVMFPQPGDLVFFGADGKVSHVMLYTGDGKVLGATGGGPKTTSVSIAKAHGAEVKYEPSDYRKDVVAYGRLDKVV